MENKKRKLWRAIAVVFAAIFAAAVIVLVLMTKGCTYDFDRFRTHGETTAEMTSSETTAETTEAVTEPPLPDNPVDWKALNNENHEIHAWIVVPGTKVDYPVVQSLEDDSFYLRRDYLGNPSVSGCIFTQSMNRRDFTDPNTVVYGHYMYDGTFFGSLHNFRDPQFFEEHKDIFVYTDGHILTYEIFAAYEYDSRHILLSFNFNDKAVFEEYLRSCLDPQSMSRNVREGVELNADSKIITLSTCVQNSDSSKRYLVQGVLIKDELTK